MPPFTITNPHDHVVHIGTTPITPKEQLTFNVLTDDCIDARNRGDITITDSALTPEELKSDAEAFKPFKTGDPAIDG